MLLRVVIACAIASSILSTTVETKQRVILSVTVKKASITANVIKYTASPSEATIYQANGSREDSRIVNSRSNSFLLEKNSYEKFSAAYQKANGEAVAVIVLELSCTPPTQLTGTAFYNCDVVKDAPKGAS